MDMITNLPTSNRHDSILAVVDHGLMKGVILIPCSKTLTADQCTILLLNNVHKWFCQGTPFETILFEWLQLHHTFCPWQSPWQSPSVTYSMTFSVTFHPWHTLSWTCACTLSLLYFTIVLLLSLFFYIYNSAQGHYSPPHIVQPESGGRSLDNHWKINEFCVEISYNFPVAVQWTFQWTFQWTNTGHRDEKCKELNLFYCIYLLLSNWHCKVNFEFWWGGRDVMWPFENTHICCVPPLSHTPPHSQLMTTDGLLTICGHQKVSNFVLNHCMYH